MNLRHRLRRLEQSQVQASAPTYFWVDDQGRVGDDGIEAMRRWVENTRSGRGGVVSRPTGYGANGRASQTRTSPAPPGLAYGVCTVTRRRPSRLKAADAV